MFIFLFLYILTNIFIIRRAKYKI